jgi:hypothetical protein
MSSILQAIAKAVATAHDNTTPLTPEELDLMRPLEQLDARKKALLAELDALDEKGNEAAREMERQLAMRHGIPLEQAPRICIHWGKKPYSWHLLGATVVQIPEDGPPKILHKLAPGQVAPAEVKPPEWAREMAEKLARGEEP